MVHGAFCGGWVFDAFRAPFERAGHRVVAPDLPGRAPPSEGPEGLSMRRYAARVAEACARQAEPPILLGHSLGGLAAQLAAMRVPVRGLILLAPCAPWGVRGASLEEALCALTMHGLGPSWGSAIHPEYALARRFLFDRLPASQSRALFARLVPESGRALWEALNWWLDPLAATFVDPARISAPVLAVAGGADVICPAGAVALTAGRLQGELRVMPTMSHWLMGEPGWREVARLCLDWIGQTEERLSVA
jgi:pimeloyl-ACP methyl ester carboxylesterase